jgi:lysozyme
MNISQAGIDLIKKFEGCRYKPYRDVAGLWTIGYGHLIGNGKTLPDQYNRDFSEGEIDELLRQDLAKFERGVTLQFPVLLRQCEFDALCSFSFNLGLSTLDKSSLKKDILSGNKEEAAKDFLKYIYAGGKVVDGLKKRRLAEQTLFLSV